MKTFSKAIIGSAAAGAMALAGATPAFARDRHHDGIDAGDVIAGALIIGGIAAIASAASKDRGDRYYDGRYDRYDRYDRYGYDNRRGSPRAAVERCVRAAERDARRAGFRRADVTDIRDVDRKNYGYRVKGRIAVDAGYRGYRHDNRGWDGGKFTCYIDGNRVRDIRYSGIRGLR